MTRSCVPLVILCLLFACSTPTEVGPAPETTDRYDEDKALREVAGNENERMRFRLIESRVLDREPMWQNIRQQLGDFGEADYEKLYPLVFEQEISNLQTAIAAKQLSYEQLTKWYLYRILKYERDPATSLHTILSINPRAVQVARERDAGISDNRHPIYGMPILLKDNINAAGMPTTAGAELLRDHQAPDATIVQRLQERGGIVLGKVNLSEWAYYFCGGCPLGYSAVGGQTLNPYGPRIFETGGSSAGSGTSMAANYAVAAVGTETAGSILSPSAQNSVVGLKPTIGLLSRTGIVPISSTLDTPGPMTRSVWDNAIVLDALKGYDAKDDKSTERNASVNYYRPGTKTSGEYRLGVLPDFLADERYSAAVDLLRKGGATLIEISPGEIDYTGFTTLLDAEMKRDLPKYLQQFAPGLSEQTVAAIVAYNRQDTFHRAPYNQSIFEGIAANTTTDQELTELQNRLKTAAINYFEGPMSEHRLDAVLSINNYSAAAAALAEYPALAVPNGYRESGEPVALTFIGRPFSELNLLETGLMFEMLTGRRTPPAAYR